MKKLIVNFFKRLLISSIWIKVSSINYYKIITINPGSSINIFKSLLINYIFI